LPTRTRTRLPRRSGSSIPGGFSPSEVYKWYTGWRDSIPDIIEFVTSDHYLDRGQILYPRQATFLKTIFLQDELFCADEETEILTRRGWMTYNQVIEGEEVLTLNTSSGLAEWSSADRLNVFPVQNEPLVLMEGDGHSSLTTPNHRWPSERLYQNRGGGFRREVQFIQTRDLRVKDRVACAAPVVDLPVEPKWSDAFVELVGWYWTEGYQVGDRAGGVVIGQSEQANPDYVARIRSCLTRLFGPPSASLRKDQRTPKWRENPDPKLGMVYFRLSGSAAMELRATAPGKDKVVSPTFINSLTSSQLLLFIETSLAADGTCSQRASGQVKRDITQKVKARLDSFQMACSLAGIRTVLSQKLTRGSGPYAGQPYWHLSLYDTRRYFSPQSGPGRNFTVTEVVHTGHVWCPTTRNGTWLARRRGKVYFTGNTDYDYEVIEGWVRSYEATADERGEGNNGIVPDILDRIRINKAQGRKWFRESVVPIGRRGGKGHVGALSGAYVLWNYLACGDPQNEYGIDRDKKLQMLVFAGKKDQAKANQWGDLDKIIRGAPCFSPYISQSTTERLSVFAPHDFARIYDANVRDIDSTADPATFEILPKESTVMSARGPAVFCLHWKTMILTSDLRWIRISELQPGDRVIGVDEGRLSRSDVAPQGHQQRKLRDAEVVAVRKVHKPALRLQFEDGSDVVCSLDHRWLYQESGAGGNAHWRMASTLKVGSRIRHLVDPWPEETSWKAGYLAGVFDGEGCVLRSNGGRSGSAVLFTQKPGVVLDTTLQYLKDLGFTPVPYNAVAFNPQADQPQQWQIRGTAECIRFLGQIAPFRLAAKSKLVWEGVSLRGGISPNGRSMGVRYKTIVEIEYLPEQELIDIETTTHTFIANGLISHNCQFYDEMAHVVKSVAKNDAEEVWNSATPSLDQFGKDAFVYEPSSPWTRIGQFYTNYQKALAHEADGSPTYPEVLMLQLASWDIYLDWEIAHTLAARPQTVFKEEITFQPLKRAVQTYDHEMEQLERANPETFAVERRSFFAAVLNAYLSPIQIARIWQPWNGRVMVTQSAGKLGILYRAHGDPSKSNANFGFAIAHREDSPAPLPSTNGHGPIEVGPFADFVRTNQALADAHAPQEENKIRVSDLPHVVFDVITAWMPGDFPDHQIDYDFIEEQFEGYIDAFMPTELSFDQWNSVSSIQHLQKYVYDKRLPKPVTVYERSATEPLNWETYETFKTAMGLNLVHGPFYGLADQELTYLQDLGHRKVDHPTAGPVQTKDVADCMAIVTHALLGDTLAAFIGQALSDLPLVGTQQGGMATHQQEANPATQQTHEALSAFGRNSNPARGRGQGRGYARRGRRR
jgi:hypothetical protein